MIRKTTNSFSFEIPDAWQTFTDAGQFVAQGPEGEEIIISSWAISGPAGSERDGLAERLLISAQRSMESAASHPALRITKPFGSDHDIATAFPCRTLLAQTLAQDVLLAQATLRSPNGVMLVTFESPNSQEHLRRFRDFIAGIGPA
jgi:hypothetical protein